MICYMDAKDRVCVTYVKALLIIAPKRTEANFWDTFILMHTTQTQSTKPLQKMMNLKREVWIWNGNNASVDVKRKLKVHASCYSLKRYMYLFTHWVKYNVLNKTKIVFSVAVLVVKFILLSFVLACSMPKSHNKTKTSLAIFGPQKVRAIEMKSPVADLKNIFLFLFCLLNNFFLVNCLLNNLESHK